MNATPSCRKCGAPLSVASAKGLCSACMLRSVLEAPPDESAAESGHLELPRTFGPYELTEEIGRGGMGVVYAARQPTLGRTVAVKLLLAGAFASEAALRRFQLEAAAAAKLQHPNIVAIHDYGECDGQPYYAMDLVAGQNLAELCAGRPLPVRRAADLLRLLAGAVHYAHQRGVLHRDLKPSNVLVDEEGRPRITDFGLAKMLGSTEGGTLTGQMLGSPSYAATEQVAGRGAEITAASDVYGLGALFYHLMTGRAPFNAATPAETARLVLETDPVPPRLLNPTLPRDVETICLKCLEKEPARRYASAADVAEDVERFLSERPIRARPPTVLYRMRKFARRHSAGVAAAGFALLALIVALGIVLAGHRRVVAQQRATDAAREQAGQLVAIISDEIKPTLEQRGGLRQLLKTTEATVRYYETLPPELRTPKTDHEQAYALDALGHLRGLALGDRQGAETALRESMLLHEKIARQNPDDPDAAAAWLWDQWELPWVTGNTAACHSEAREEEFVRRWGELQRRFPDNARVMQGWAEVLATYAMDAVDSFNKPKEAVTAATQCRALAEELVAARPQDKALGALLEKCLRAQANVFHGTGELSRAIVVCEEALAYFTKALKADPGNLKLLEQTADAAWSLRDRVFWNNCERGHQAEVIAREHYRTLIQLDPDNQDYRFRYAMTHSLEYIYLRECGSDFESMRKALREFQALLEPFAGRKGYEGVLMSLAKTRLDLAQVAAWAGEPAEAQREIEQAQPRFAAWYSSLPEGSPQRYASRVLFLFFKSRVPRDLRDWPALEAVASELHVEIDAGLRQQPANDEMRLHRAAADSILGVALQGEGRSAEAIARLRPAVEIMRAPPRGVRFALLGHFVGPAQVALTEALVQQGDLKEARQALGDPPPCGNIWEPDPWPTQEWKAHVLVLAASVRDPAEAFLCLAQADQAETVLTSPAGQGKLSTSAKEDLAKIARLRAAVAARFDLSELEKAGRGLDEAAAADPVVIERLTQAGEALDYGSPSVRQVQLAARESCRALMARYPENQGYRFLFAETHRMECGVSFVEPARAAYRQYDALLEPFVGRKGYDSVRRTRLSNSLHLAQLAASVGDRADANGWLEEARKRFEAYRDRLPEGSPDRGLARARFLEESAWCAWWLRDWPDLARLAQAAQAECDAKLKEQPSNDELILRGAMAEGFAALAVAGAGRNTEAAPLLLAARSRLFWICSLADSQTELGLIENAMIQALRNIGNLAQARGWAEERLTFQASWFLNLPADIWENQKDLAEMRILVASVLDPTIPSEAARRQELLDQAAAILAPDKVAGRLTVDVQEMLQEIQRLRVATAPPR
ncbi:MAG TPA: serine/threonine-protein kinase [Opitutaceae bacterium]|nr:serine/threonine-protein kinase [Opitutaceae bacterium]